MLAIIPLYVLCIIAITNPNNSSDYKGVIFGLLFVFGWFVLFSSLASGPKNHWLPWIIFTSEYRKQHRNNTPSSRNSNSSSFSNIRLNSKI